MHAPLPAGANVPAGQEEQERARLEEYLPAGQVKHFPELLG